MAVIFRTRPEKDRLCLAQQHFPQGKSQSPPLSSVGAGSSSAWGNQMTAKCLHLHAPTPSPSHPLLNGQQKNGGRVEEGKSEESTQDQQNSRREAVQGNVTTDGKRNWTSWHHSPDPGTQGDVMGISLRQMQMNTKLTKGSLCVYSTSDEQFSKPSVL